MTFDESTLPPQSSEKRTLAIVKLGDAMTLECRILRNEIVEEISDLHKRGIITEMEGQYLLAATRICK